jgi:hypothetical protein
MDIYGTFYAILLKLKKKFISHCKGYHGNQSMCKAALFYMWFIL